MIRLGEVCALVGRVDERELREWIAAGWILPAGSEPDWQFSTADVGRVRLICELRRDLAIDEEAVPVLLDLLDQVYGLRARLKALAAAVAAEPPEVRERILDAVRRDAALWS